MEETPNSTLPVPDPFADVPEEKGKKMTTAAVKRAEKGTFTNQAVANPTAPLAPEGLDLSVLSLPELGANERDGQVLAYSRVEDLAEQAGFFKLEEIAGIDLIITKIAPALSAQYRNPDGTAAEYSLCEFYFRDPSENPDPERGEAPYTTVVGGRVALPRLKSAAKKIILGMATGPLVAAFEAQYTAAGQMFWNVK